MYAPIYAPKNLPGTMIRMASPGGMFEVAAARLTDNDGEPLMGTSGWTQQLRDLQKRIEPHEYTSLWAINGEVFVVFEGVTIKPFEAVCPEDRAKLLSHILDLQQKLADLPCRVVLPNPQDIELPGLTLWCVMPAAAFRATDVNRISLVINSVATPA